MKRLIIILVFLTLLLGCNTWQQFFHKDSDLTETPLLISDQEDLNEETFDKAAAEGKIIEGMSCSLVEQSWGSPENTTITESGFIVWEYKTSKLFFLDDVLIAWIEK